MKIMGGMDISEKRKPQDGRMSVMVDRREYDIRISSIPTVHGEKIVMRISSKLNLTRDIKELGLDQEEMATLQHMLAKPYGIMFVTGPTGSGKSTTLYTALSALNKEAVNIVTVEDPRSGNRFNCSTGFHHRSPRCFDNAYQQCSRYAEPYG